MNRSDVLHMADDLINGQRAKDYGDAKDNFTAIARMWSAYLGEEDLVTAYDVAIMMALLKAARVRMKPHADSEIDGAAYFALASELGDG